MRNRVYVGETHHGGKWFKDEHKPIVDRGIFDGVQELLKANCVQGNALAERALLKGKLFDDRGNPMGPTFSNKNGVRYRFYVNSAVRRGR